MRGCGVRFSPYEEAVALAHYAALDAVPSVPDVGWWVKELERVGRNPARRAGVIVAAQEAGVTESELTPNVERRRRMRLVGLGTQHFKIREEGQAHGS
jgi:hypothetical protein